MEWGGMERASVFRRSWSGQWGGSRRSTWRADLRLRITLGLGQNEGLRIKYTRSEARRSNKRLHEEGNKIPAAGFGYQQSLLSKEIHSFRQLTCLVAASVRPNLAP